MFHFIFKLVGLVVLALSVVFAVLDITRSITASEFILTPLARTWANTSPQSLQDVKLAIESWGVPFLWDPVLVLFLKLPTWLVLWFIAMVLMKMGQKKENPYGRFASR